MIATDNMINKLNKRILYVAEKLGSDNNIYKNYSDYLISHGINIRYKNGVVQIIRGKKANLTNAMANAISDIETLGQVKEAVRKRGEKATKAAIKKAAYVKAELNNIKEFIYNKTGEREIQGLSGTKGKKTYSELYNILMKYSAEYEQYKKFAYEELEEF